MGLVAAAASFGQFAVVLPTMWMNKEFGWQTSLIILATVTISLLILLPLLNEKNDKSNKNTSFGLGLKNTIMFSIKEKNYLLLISRFFCLWFSRNFSWHFIFQLI